MVKAEHIAQHDFGWKLVYLTVVMDNQTFDLPTQRRTGVYQPLGVPIEEIIPLCLSTIVQNHRRGCRRVQNLAWAANSHK